MSSTNVKELHQILLWPLRIVPGVTPKEIDKRLTLSHWKEVEDRLLRGRGNSSLAYSEFVYFHPFAQQFLYGNKNKDENENDIKLYTQSNHDKAIKGARVYLYGDNGKTNPVELTFEHIHLYHFHKMSLFILAVEVSVEQELSMEEAENFLDQFRRSYPPYWGQGNEAGHCPFLVELFSTAQKREKELSNRVSVSNYWQKDAFMGSPYKHGQPSVSTHWQRIMEPLCFENPADDKDSAKIYCKHVVDDRIPHMAHLAIEYPLLLKKGDMIRLGLADASGTSDTLPYATAFLDNFEEKYCYDRFWEGGRNMQEWKNTRYIITDYSFTAIGAWKKTTEKHKDCSEFCNPEYGILAHFRSHYFQMNLVAQMYRASLLSLADQLAETIRDLQSTDRGKKEEMRDRARDLQHQLLTFTHRYWFTEISNQLQGKELFTMILKNQQTENLYEQVKSASAELYEFQETDFQRETAISMSRLTVVATIGLIASLTLAVFSICNIPTAFKSFLENWPVALIVVIGAITLAALVTLSFSKPLENIFNCLSEKKSKSSVGWFCGCLAALFPKKGNRDE